MLEMGEAARGLGYEYLAICDHTRNVRVVPGLDADEVRRQGEEIAAANERLAPFRILRGIECDILPDGSLDLPDDVLAELDWVQASVHARPASAAGRAHEADGRGDAPPGGALPEPSDRADDQPPPAERGRPGAGVRGRARDGRAVEVNGLPARLDLRDEHVRLAFEAGVPVVCSTDAHSIRGLGNMQLAVATARRGWATAADIVNTRPLAEVWRRRLTLGSCAAGLVAPVRTPIGETRARLCAAPCREWNCAAIGVCSCPGPCSTTRAPRTSACPRSASATCGSVCVRVETFWSRSAQIAIASSGTSPSSRERVGRQLRLARRCSA